MSNINIRRAFEKRLALMTPALSTQYENVAFTPVANVPYQKAFLLPAEPENPTMGDAYRRYVGVFQVTLCYPINTNALAIQTRAEAIANHFKRATSMIEAGQTVLVLRTPTISAAFVTDDRYNVVVSIFYQSELFG